jgi:hypothetical protein
MAFNGTGSNVTSLNATNIASGTVAPARLGSGTPSSSNFLRGDGSWQTPAGAPSPLHGKQVFTSSGTFNVPTGVTSVKVSVIGAGGNGGTGTSDWQGGGGGGAGGYVVDYVSVTSGGTATVTVGTNGGSRTSSFAGATTITATGGANGSNGNPYGNINPVYRGVDAPTTVLGLTYYLGGVCRETDNAVYLASTAMSTTATTVATAAGGCWNHGFGTAGAGRAGSSSSLYIPLGYGGGAGGGNQAKPYRSGGTGANGLVVVEW